MRRLDKAITVSLTWHRTPADCFYYHESREIVVIFYRPIS